MSKKVYIRFVKALFILKTKDSVQNINAVVFVQHYIVQIGKLAIFFKAIEIS